MGLVFDSSVLIEAERGNFNLKNFLNKECTNDTLFITAVTATELLHGWEQAPQGKKKDKRKEFVEYIINGYEVLSFDLAAARYHAQLWTYLKGQGLMIGAHDLLIASICLSLKHKLATLNQKEFSRVPGLILKDVQGY